jgi:hypothetical protein
MGTYLCPGIRKCFHSSFCRLTKVSREFVDLRLRNKRSLSTRLRNGRASAACWSNSGPHVQFVQRPSTRQGREGTVFGECGVRTMGKMTAGYNDEVIIVPVTSHPTVTRSQWALRLETAQHLAPQRYTVVASPALILFVLPTGPVFQVRFLESA